VRVSSAQLAPLRLQGFRNLFYAMLGSSVGTLLAAVALAIDVKDRTASSPHSGLWVAAVLIVEFLPTIVVGLLLGPLLDRLERRSLMIAADALRVAVFVALPFAPNAATVVGLALVAGLATGFFRPAVYAGIPNLVPDEELRATLEADMPPFPLSYFDTGIDMPVGWGDRPCGYVLLGPEFYGATAENARNRGWPVREIGGGHLAPASRPVRVTEALLELERVLRTAPAPPRFAPPAWPAGSPGGTASRPSP